MDAFTAVSDPTRRRIVELLASGERSFGEIASGFDISAPAVSQHLRLLRETGVVSVRPEAQRRIYSLESEGLSEVDAWVSGVRRFWSDRLDRLDATLRSTPTESGDKDD